MKAKTFFIILFLMMVVVLAPVRFVLFLYFIYIICHEAAHYWKQL